MDKTQKTEEKIQHVVLDETVSEDLLEMARKILNGELK